MQSINDEHFASLSLKGHHSAVDLLTHANGAHWHQLGQLAYLKGTGELVIGE